MVVCTHTHTRTATAKNEYHAHRHFLLCIAQNHSPLLTIGDLVYLSTAYVHDIAHRKRIKHYNKKKRHFSVPKNESIDV